LATALLLSLNSAFATQIITGKQDETLSATISRADPTLIRIDGHKIRRIFGAENEFAVVPDKDAGDLYIKPTTDKQVISIFVSDENGRTWKLLLSVVNTPTDTILIKERHSASDRKIQQGKDLPREESIKEMLFSLVSNQNDDNYDEQDTNDLVPLWKEAEFTRIKIIKGNSLTGEEYRLTNISDKPMVIDERELYRKGVVAVSVDKPDLQPGNTTAVEVISTNKEDDE
jgi:conjugal transfer pilus assembly protein TraK